MRPLPGVAEEDRCHSDAEKEARETGGPGRLTTLDVSQRLLGGLLAGNRPIQRESRNGPDRPSQNSLPARSRHVTTRHAHPPRGEGMRENGANSV